MTVATVPPAGAAAAAWSSSSPTAGRATRSLPAVRDQAGAALARPGRPVGRAARRAARLPRRLLGPGRRRARRGRRDPAGGAVRLFHVLQAGARAEGRAIAAKGLTGPGYDGHCLLGHRDVRAARAHLTRARGRRRRAALAALHPAAGHRAGRAARACRARRSRGGRSPARSARATGRRARPRSTSTPTSPTRWSATSDATDDEAFERGAGLELLVETARLWRSLGHHDAQGRFRIDGVTGPDEYSAIADNNVYTNLMAQQNLRRRRRRRGPPSRTGPASSASTRRRRPAGATPPRRCSSPTTRRSASTRRPKASPATRSGTSPPPPPTQYPLLLHFPYFDLYRKQVVKQADLVLAMHLSRGRVHRRAEGPQLRLLRAAHGPGLVAVGLHPGGDRRRGRPARAGLSTTSARPR